MKLILTNDISITTDETGIKIELIENDIDYNYEVEDCQVLMN